MRDELAHSPVDLGKQIAVGGVERVVEVEHPGLDMVESLARLFGLPAHDDPLLPLSACAADQRAGAMVVKSSSSTACGTRPSRMTTRLDALPTTSRHPSILGIMPPEIVPSAISAAPPSR